MMMGDMSNTDHPGTDLDALSVECATCVAAGTTACADCVVTHLLANDDGPIEYVAVTVNRPPTAIDRAVELFARAGLLDDPVCFVAPSEFETAVVPSMPAHV